ncbi:MAG: hypothetical protein SGILL_003649 [Bacillariaceae sp.]
MKMPFASMRMSRTTGKDILPEAESIPQSMSDPMDLERNYSDDSSVFSGLAEARDGDDIDDIDVDDVLGEQILDPTTGTGTDGGDVSHHGYENRFYDEQQRRNTTAPKGILRGYSSPTPSTFSSSKIGGSSSEESDYTSVLPSDVPTESTLTDRSRRSLLREMPPMVDSDTAFGPSSTISTSGNTKRTDAGSSDPSMQLPVVTEADGRADKDLSSGTMSTRRLMSSAVNPDMFSDSDTNTQMTWASVDDMPRPKGTVKLVSSVSFLEDQKKGQQLQPQQQQQQYPYHNQPQDDVESRGPIEESASDDSGSRIVEMLSDFEKKMDASLKSIREDSPNKGMDNTAEVLAELQDVAPRRAKSEEEGSNPVLTPHKAKKLQRILHKAREEVEVLRDNNEQYKSEIEQMEEEHKSELKLVEDRTKQKLAELRSMYQEEIDKLVSEKDAAVIEAGRQAARYAESGKKQVFSMKKQLERLTTTATATIKEKVEEAGRNAITQKDKEVAARLGALRTSYENELEKVRKECDERVKQDVEKAVSSVAQRVRLNQDVLVSELKDQVEDLRKERKSIDTILKAVKGNFSKHYPVLMTQYERKSQDFEGSARKLLEDRSSVTEGVESELKEVIETFAFLLQCQEKKVKSAQCMSEIEETKRERNEVYGQMRKELLLRHRAEIEHMRKEKAEAQEKLKEMEANFKNLDREKRFLEEKHKRAMENHRVQLEKQEAEKKAAVEIERSKRELAAAMAAASKRAFNSNPPKHPDHQKIHVRKPSLDGLDIKLSESMDACSIPHPSPKLESPRANVTQPQKHSIETASVRRARTFMSHHSPRNSSPRFSPRASPRLSSNNRPGVLKEKQPVAEESPIKSYDLMVPEKKIHTPKAAKTDENAQKITDIKSKTSVLDPGASHEFQASNSLEPSAMTATLRESVDPVPDINISKSDASNSSVRSKDTILSNLRNQAKKAKNATTESRIESNGENATSDSSARRKSFAILRTFKSHKEPNRRDSTPAPQTPAHGTKDPDGKSENHNIMTRSIRRARIIKNLFESNGKNDESQRSRRSLDLSISSLQTNTGVTSGGGTTAVTESIATESTRHENDRQSDSVLDARQSKTCTETKTAKTTSTQTVTEKDANVSRKKSQNTLTMFVHAKKPKDPEEVVFDDPTSMSSEMNPEALETQDVSVSLEATGVTQKGRYAESVIDGSSHLNFKKMSTVGYDQSIAGHVPSAYRLNGKKKFPESTEQQSLDPVFTMQRSSSDSDVENTVPKTVTVISPTSSNTYSKSSNGHTLHTATAKNGHTLLAKPLTLKHSKGYPQEAISNLSQVTSATAPSSDEDGLMYDSQAQMRKFPPLTDDEVSEEESGIDSRDKYQMLGSPTKQNQHHPQPSTSESPSIPLVASTSVEEDAEDIRKSIVVEGKHVSNGAASLKLSGGFHGRLHRNHFSETSSTAGSNVSEATTAVTAHTRSVTFGSGRRSKNLSAPQSNTHTSARFAALKARVRVRKDALL